MFSSVAVATWNLEWRESASEHAATLRSRLLELKPAIACVTECYDDFFGNVGHVVGGGDDWGYPFRAGRRKVALWSEHPWRDVDTVGSPDMPPGRYVAGTTDTAIGEVRVIGVCIPWRDAHVASGRRDRSPWQDHVAFLDQLKFIVGRSKAPLVLLGDFNQRHPRKWQPHNVYAALEDALSPKLKLATGGLIAGIDQQAIDHIAYSDDFRSVDVTGLSNFSPSGVRLTDHFGVATRLVKADNTSSLGLQV